MSEGYIRLQRSIINWEWVDDPNTLRLWIQLLCTANWKPAKYKGIDVGPGQRVASLTQLADEMGMSVDMVRTGKKHLCSTGEITCKRTQYGDLITIENWAKYQVREIRTDTADDTGADSQTTRDMTGDRHESEEVEEDKNIIISARTPAPTRPHIEEKEWDFSDGKEVSWGVWMPNKRPVTDEEKRENYYKCRAFFRKRKEECDA